MDLLQQAKSRESEFSEFKVSEQTETNIWLYFKRHKSGLSAWCKLCPSSPEPIIQAPKYSKSGMIYHLKSKHEIDIKNIKPNSVVGNSAGASTTNDDDQPPTASTSTASAATTTTTTKKTTQSKCFLFVYSDIFITKKIVVFLSLSLTYT
jgi:hypothetical protein